MFYGISRRALCVALCLFVAATAAPPQRAARIIYLPYEDVRPTLETLAEVIPSDLKSGGSTPETWAAWVKRRDAEIRRRLDQGDEDTIINLLFFGTSFTKQPRVTAAQIERLRSGEAAANAAGASGSLIRLLSDRLNDLLRAASAPAAADDDRLSFVREVLAQRNGFDLKTEAGHKAARAHILSNLNRVLKEQNGLQSILQAAQRSGDASAIFAERSKLFSARGLSSDTTLPPNFAVEESLKTLLQRGILSRGGVARVAVIGPGLDITDKQEGYDIYAQQTIQPFALMDSLQRLGLASRDLRVQTLDLSRRVNDHLRRARERAARGDDYVIRLPYDPRLGWTPDLIRYRQRFGETIKSAAPPAPASPLPGGVELRAVRIRPDVVLRVVPLDLNVVLQRLDLAAADRFDLIVATNILVYYDTFEQSLALLNIERMLRPGGLLLSNNAVLELPASGVRSVGYSATAYSDRPDDGDFVVWYQRAKD